MSTMSRDEIMSAIALDCDLIEKKCNALREEVDELKQQNDALRKVCEFCEQFAEFSCAKCQLTRAELTVPCHADCEHRARIRAAIANSRIETSKMDMDKDTHNE